VCAGTAPNHFTLEGGYAVPTAEEVDPDDAVVSAAESCPMEAILVTEIGSDKVIAPEL
jgi:ferredoxin